MQASLQQKLFGVVQRVTIDRFVILERLGEGGMGLVYAVYDDKLDRKVALKLIKGDAGSSLGPRLQREAQAMAKLSHPNLVPVFEVGEHEGQLFLVMEYVRGQTLRQWVAAQRRDTVEVLDKYVQAGRGLAAAHAEGIVHRDFKPDNAIVGTSGRVRVLDFGLARSQSELSQSDAEMTLTSLDSGILDAPLTETGTMVGTPAYMAPEQWAGDALDHRADQFSFCVALWEALGGARPFAGQTKLALVTAVEEGALEVPPRAIPSRLRRILERGLCVEPARRWESMSALVDALEREIGGRSGARQRRALVGAVGACAFVGLAIWTSHATRTNACTDGPAELATVWNDARRQRVREALAGVDMGFAAATAERVDERFMAYAEAWIGAHREACEATVAGTQSEERLEQRMRCLQDRKRHLDALASVFEAADADTLRKSTQAASTLPSIDRCADADYVMGEEPPLENPAAERRRADVLALLAESRATLETGRYPDALDLAIRGLEEARALGHDSLVVRATTLVSEAHVALGEYDAATAAALEGFVLADAGSHRTAAENVLALGQALSRQGRTTEAIAHAKRALALFRRGGADARTLAAVHLRLGVALRDDAQWDDARAAFEAALETEDDILVAKIQQEYGALLEVRGDYDASLELARVAVDSLERTLGNDHPDVASALVGAGIKLSQLRRDDEAQALYRRALEIQHRAFAGEHPQIATTNHNYALSLVRQGKYEEALERYRSALDVWRRTLGDEHPNVVAAHDAIGAAHQSKGDYEAALAHHEAALAISQKVHGPMHPSLGATLGHLGNVLGVLGRHVEAEQHLRRSLEIDVASLGEHHPAVAADHNALREILSAMGRYDEAREHARASLALWDSIGAEQPKSAWAHLGMGYLAAETGDCETALEHLEAAVARFDAGYSDTHSDHARPAAAIVLCAHRLGRSEVAQSALERLGRLAQVVDAPRYVLTLRDLAQAVHEGDAADLATARAALEGLGLRPFEVLTRLR